MFQKLEALLKEDYLEVRGCDYFKICVVIKNFSIIFSIKKQQDLSAHPSLILICWGLLQPLPWVFAVLQYLGNILPLIDSLSCNL